MDSTQIKPCSNLSGKIRVVARIRGFRDQELASDAACSSSIISVHKSGDSGPSEKITISFDDQTSSRKNEYEVDHCYLQNEDTALIFSKEIKPQITKVFDGENSTFIAFGARGSGKTYTIQGSKENLGLGMMVMDEILKIVEGGRHAVAISFYEVFQNHVYDLLDSKNPEVQVLEDAQGKIKLRGLSKVRVESMLEFQKLYCSGSSSNKPTQKITTELPRRSHKALMIHILACDEGGNPRCVGKMNFVDLAGYENVKRNSVDGTNIIQSTQINKSLNALLNVIHAVSANESRVPYRESIIARVLQDSLGRTSHISMLICLNPFFCLDSIHAVALASRLKNIKPLVVSSVKKQTNSRVHLSANKANSGVAVFSTTKKQTNSRLPLSAKKTNVVLKGRNLFGGTEQAKCIKKQELSTANNPIIIGKSDIPSCDSTVIPYVKEENNSPNILKSDIPDGDSTIIPYVKEEKCTSDGVLFSPDVIDVHSDILASSHEEDAEVKTQNICLELIPAVNGDNIEKENNSLPMNNSQSTPLSSCLIKLRDRLKSESSTTLCVTKPQEVEPKTPVITYKMNFSNCPSGSFSKRSSGMKQSLVKDYLQFLNSACKDELKGIPGIGEKRASYILELREESPQPFKSLDDLQDIGLSAKQVKTMMKKVAGELFG